MTEPPRTPRPPDPPPAAPSAERAPIIVEILRTLRTVIWYGARKFARDRTTLLAAALAYRTVFSLIPILVLTVVAVRSFSDQDSLRNRIFEWFALDEITVTLPTGEAGHDQIISLAQLVDQLVDKAMIRVTEINFTAITAVGVAILIYAAMSLLIQIEQAFNAVYGATSGRKLMMRLTNYWSLLTLGSLALVVSFSLSDWIGDVLRSLPGGFAITSALAEFLTTVGVTWLLLIFAYVRMPTTRVKLRPAAAGAAIAAGLWELAKQGLTYFISHATSGQVSVYGSLALIPLFLLWIQITWMIVLIGLQITFAIQNFSNAALLKAEDRRRERDPLIDPAIGVILMREVSRTFKNGKSRSLQSLADVANITELLAHPILERLTEVGLLNKVEKGDDSAYSLARPAETISVNEILGALRDLIPDPRDLDESRILKRILDTQFEATEGLSLDALDHE